MGSAECCIVTPHIQGALLGSEVIINLNIVHVQRSKIISQR
jgi:hypothetical protein